MKKFVLILTLSLGVLWSCSEDAVPVQDEQNLELETTKLRTNFEDNSQMNSRTTLSCDCDPTMDDCEVITIRYTKDEITLADIPTVRAEIFAQLCDGVCMWERGQPFDPWYEYWVIWNYEPFINCTGGKVDVDNTVNNDPRVNRVQDGG